MRLLDFSDGFESAAEPTAGFTSATSLSSYANDAAYVTAKDAVAADGDAYYNTTDDMVRVYRDGAWEYVAMQPKVTGTRASPSSIVAGTGVAFTGKLTHQLWFIQGSGGAVTVTANPRVAAGSYVGQRLTLVGRSDTNTVTIGDGQGMALNGDWVGAEGSVLNLIWDGTNWAEESRNDL